MKKICENCQKKHDGLYGSGRFCSEHCKRSWCSKQIKNHKCNFNCHKNNNGRKPYGTWVCPYCEVILNTKHERQKHIHEYHVKKDLNGKTISWNKGLTKESDKRILLRSKKISDKYKNGKLRIWCYGQHLTDEHKKKISNSMKKAHKDGRAHNIGISRWNNEPSYPEKWFMLVIENEFIDKHYIREYPFHKFSLDFAWVEKKKSIEIDGEQHQRFIEYKKRDKRKDRELEKEGWQILRLNWKEVFFEPKKWIQIANDFIGS